MKHDWKRNGSGEIEDFGDDYPYAQCRLCGDTATIGRASEIEADDCEGLDLNVTVSVCINHPGRAREYDDERAVAWTKTVSLAEVVYARPDVVAKAIGDAAEVITGTWRGAKTAHQPAWRTAVEEASRRKAEESEVTA